MDNKPKIAFITERMLKGFGVDLVVHKTAEGLARKGYEVTVFAIRKDETYDNPDYKIETLPCPLIWNPLKQEYYSFKSLKNFLKYLEFDLFIIETFPFNFFPIFLKEPCIIVDYGVSSSSGMPWKTKLRLNYMKVTQNMFYFPFADQLITGSKYLKSTLPPWLQAKSKVIYNGVDHYPKENGLKSKVEEFKKKLRIKKNDKILLYVGRLNYEKQPYKGTKQLVEIYQKLKSINKNIRLVMAGFGDKEDEKYLKRKEVLPIVNAPVSLMPVLYSACDIYVTATKWEGFNLPLLEAQYFGKPGVCFNIGPHQEVIKDKKSAFVVKSKRQFIKRIEELAKNKNLYQKMAYEAEKNAKRFSWKKAVEKYEKVIKKTLKRSKTVIQRTDYHDKVNVITLNYNGKRFLRPFFESLKKQTYKNFDVTMVDNGSSDNSVNYVRKNFPLVKVIALPKNLFFAKGNNLGVKNTKGEYILLVNNDTVLEPTVIEEMVRTIKKNLRIAAVAPKMLFYKNKKIIDSIGTAIAPDGSPFNRGIGQVDIGQYDKEEEVFGACFGGVLLRRKLYEIAVGPLDNDYFGYFEDVDWCYRALGMGFKIVTCPKAVLYHNHSGTAKKFSYEWKYYLIHRNLLRTIFKNFGKRNAIRKGLKKILALIKHAKIPPSPERRKTCFKILFNTLLYSPILFIKRLKVRSKRNNSITDEMIWSFSQNEIPFFDPVKYRPEHTIENIKFSYLKKCLLNDALQIKDDKTRKALIRLNLLTVNYWLYTKDERNSLIDLIEEDFKRDMGEESGHFYAKELRDI